MVNKFINKSLLSLLVVLMLFGVVTPNVFAMENEDLSKNISTDVVEYTSDSLVITMDGEQVNNVEINKYSKITLVANSNRNENVVYQWQIERVDKPGVWVNIYGENSNSLNVTYALVANMLSNKSSANVRCTTLFDNVQEVSQTVLVNVINDTATTFKINSPNVVISNNEDSNVDVEFITVKIEYPLYEWVKVDGVFELKKRETDAYTPYIAILEANSNHPFNKSVKVPSIVGYQAFLVDMDANTEIEYNDEYFNISIPKVETNNFTYTIAFKPAEAKYKVKYFFQNIYDDEYVEDVTIGASVNDAVGITGLHPAESLTRKEFPGFTSLFFQPEVIAGDGSTVFNVYYERNYYLLELDNAGGFGADTIYVRHGSHISVPNPVKAGYSFVGWDVVDDPNPQGDDTIPTTMPIGNSKYVAFWRKASSSYSVSYWLRDGEKTELLGSKIVPANTGDIVSGVDDIINSVVCGLDEHQHTDECIECENPDHLLHTHTEACYNYVTSKGGQITSSSGKDWTVIQNVNQYITPQPGYLYLIYTSGDNGNNQKWPKMSYVDANGNLEYYTVALDNANPIRNENISNYVDGEKITTGQIGNEDFYVDVYKAKTTCSGNIHTNECIKCGKVVHNHVDHCKSPLSTDVVFLEGDQNVEVKGDGSSVVNVYYRHMRYTLRFYYAKSRKDYNGNVEYKIVGGTTYGFGTYNDSNENSSVNELLKNVEDNQWGKIKEKPTLRTNIADKYTEGSIYDETTKFTYYYFEFNTEYGEMISDIWPVDVFNPVEIDETHAQCNEKFAYFSAWNGEYRVKYSQDNSYKHKRGSANETIKGVRFYVDDDILFDSQFGAAETYTPTNSSDNTCLVSYLCFWENGANISWSIPRLFRYRLYLKKDDNYTLENTYNVYDNNIRTEYTIPYIDGFMNVSDNCVDVPENEKISHLDEYYTNIYYDPVPYKLIFWNYNRFLTDGSGSSVLAGTNLAKHGEYLNEELMLTKYPDALEKGAYYFDGWYKSGTFEPETKITDWSSEVMPKNNMMLYAKWTKKKHNVYFYEDYAKYQANEYWYRENSSGNNVPESYPIVVEHGTLLEELYRNEPTSDDGSEFVGWFYMDEGNKKRFAPTSMVIKKELHLFAEWKTTQDATYTVTYVLDEPTIINGVSYPAGHPIGEPMTGHITAGKTKTFEAKSYSELLNEFQDPRLKPTVNSHSLLIEPNDDNHYEFRYKIDESIWYRVRYIDKITGLDITFPGSEEATQPQQSDAAIITKKFIPISGYIPEEYFVEKVLAADGAAGTAADIDRYNNVLIFYYIPDEVNSLYSIEHWLQDENNVYQKDLSEYGSHEIGQTFEYNITPDKFIGYTYNRAEVTTYVDGVGTTVIYNNPSLDKISALVAKEGLEIRLYYNRNSYPYTIKYVEYGTGIEFVDKRQTGSRLYLDTLEHTQEESFIDYNDNVVYVSYPTEEKPSTQSLTIGITDNVLTFYYQAKVTNIFYQAVCFVPGAINYGNVTLNYEPVKTNAEVQGSNAITGKGYKFIGWFKDEGCTVPVNSSWVENTLLKPEIGEEQNVIYYAKFEPMFGSLKIIKDITNETIPVEDVFLFRIKGQGKLSFIDMVVSIEGSDSITLSGLPTGLYDIAELSDWSWKYSTTITSGTIEIVDEEHVPTITFTNTVNEVDWLNKEYSKKNSLSGKTN